MFNYGKLYRYQRIMYQQYPGIGVPGENTTVDDTSRSIIAAADLSLQYIDSDVNMLIIMKYLILTVHGSLRAP